MVTLTEVMLMEDIEHEREREREQAGKPRTRLEDAAPFPWEAKSYPGAREWFVTDAEQGNVAHIPYERFMPQERTELVGRAIGALPEVLVGLKALSRELDTLYFGASRYNQRVNELQLRNSARRAKNLLELLDGVTKED